jgi:AcrR family transcriptional regulator
MPPRDRTKRRVAPGQARARASIDAILTAAEMILSESGFTRMTTNRIAARAGVNVALVYRYFAGKEAIVGALIERVAEQTHLEVSRVLAENAHAPLSIGLRELLRALVNTPGVPALHRELVEHVGVAKRHQVVEEARTAAAALFTTFLTQRQGELRPHADPEAILFVLQHAIEAATHAIAFNRPDGLSIERALDALTEVVTRTLLPDAVARDAR